jgi:hypothetical protein
MIALFAVFTSSIFDLRDFPIDVVCYGNGSNPTCGMVGQLWPEMVARFGLVGIRLSRFYPVSGADLSTQLSACASYVVVVLVTMSMGGGADSLNFATFRGNKLVAVTALDKLPQITSLFDISRLTADIRVVISSDSRSHGVVDLLELGGGIVVLEQDLFVPAVAYASQYTSLDSPASLHADYTFTGNVTIAGLDSAIQWRDVALALEDYISSVTFHADGWTIHQKGGLPLTVHRSLVGGNFSVLVSDNEATADMVVRLEADAATVHDANISLQQAVILDTARLPGGGAGPRRPQARPPVRRHVGRHCHKRPAHHRRSREHRGHRNPKPAGARGTRQEKCQRSAPWPGRGRRSALSELSESFPPTRIAALKNHSCLVYPAHRSSLGRVSWPGLKPAADYSVTRLIRHISL